jgi:hypothetical protein
VDSDIKVLQHYLELFIDNKPILNPGSRVDCKAELAAACESLSDRLETLEAFERNRNPARTER